jgi:ABC-type lipoprotein release transport system permease subunit
LQRLAGNVPFSDNRVAQQAVNVQRAIHPQAIALWMLGGFLGLTAALVLAQLLARRSTLAADDYPALWALGMTRAELWLSEMVPAAAIGVVGGGLALAVAVAASPLFPLGTARVAERNPGVSVDALVLGVGAVAVAAIVLILAAIPSWRAASQARHEVDVARYERPGLLSRSVAAAGLPPTATVGVGLGLTSGRGATAVPVRTSLTGVALAVAALATALTFAGSLTHLLSTPRLYGWNWDARITTNGATTIVEPLLAKIKDDPRLEAVTLADSGVPVQVGKSAVAGLGLRDVKGHIAPLVLTGREPQAADEVAIGAKTARDLNVHLGQRVPVSITAIEQLRVPKRVVGTVVLPPTSTAGRLGDGVILTYEGEVSLAPPEVTVPPPTDAIFRFAPDVNRSLALADLRRLAGRDYSITTPEPPTDIVNFGRVQNLPAILAGLLALLAAATLGHTLITSVSRRARDLAVLKTLGFTAAQVRRTVAWQSTALTLAALIIGLPVGVALGRVLWTAFADQLGVLSRPTTSPLYLALMVPAGLIVANLVAAVPALIASRTRPAVLLRTQ